MNIAQLIAEFREVADDVAGPPYAWATPRVLFWLSEGQDRFCEETGFWTDFSTYQIITVEGQTAYPIDGRIIEVKEVWDEGRLLHQFIEGDRPHAVSTQDPMRPLSWQADRETGVLTLLQPPVGGLTLKLRVWRYSKVPLSRAASPEIPERFHLALVEYAAAKAYGDHDRERQDPVKAAAHMANFMDVCVEGRRAFDRINAAPPRITPNPLYVV